MDEYEANWEKCCREFKEKLITENKDLKESIKDIVHTSLDWHKKYIEIKQSRNKLLDACQELIIVNNYPLTKSFRLAVNEALKEK